MGVGVCVLTFYKCQGASLSQKYGLGDAFFVWKRGDVPQKHLYTHRFHCAIIHFLFSGLGLQTLEKFA